MDKEIEKQVQEAIKEFRKFSESATTNAERVLVQGSLKIEADAKKNAPVKTGRLRSSITHRLRHDENNNAVVDIGTNVFYAIFKEFGTFGPNETIRMAPTPFLIPAYEANKEKILRAVEKAISETGKNA